MMMPRRSTSEKGRSRPEPTTGRGRPGSLSRAFTLIEIIMALAASAVILAAIYGVFFKAVHLRDDATARTHDARLRARAAGVIRNDLRNALISGGTLAAILSSQAGHLKFTATTAKDPGDVLPVSDVQQIEYYVARDPDATDQKAGLLVRTVDHNLLATVRQTPPEETLLAGVESMEVTFYDGDSWQESWEYSQDNKTLPEAIRVRILSPAGAAPPIEVLVPWTTQASIEAATTTTTTGGSQ
ncbi:MAG: Type secretion system protein [Chthoniobacter sp.]|jgi:type II secretion system protein J|nr:Type secretion system protein [Chthoniobacter sp.]